MKLEKSNMPQLGLGTFRLKGAVAYESVTTALELGYRHIDTAQIYGNEVEVGKAIRDYALNRDELFVTTKAWNNTLTKAAFCNGVEQSLDRLQLDYVDLLLIHWPAPPGDEPMSEYIGELLKSQEQGLARHVGVSNFNIALLTEAMALMPEGQIFTNQVEVHPYMSNAKLRSFCNEKNIHITAYMPFAVGKVLNDPVVVGIADAYGVTSAEVVIAWELAHGMASIPSSTKRKNLKANLKGASLVLSANEIAKIDALDRNDRIVNLDFSPIWD